MPRGRSNHGMVRGDDAFERHCATTLFGHGQGDVLGVDIESEEPYFFCMVCLRLFCDGSLMGDAAPAVIPHWRRCPAFSSHPRFCHSFQHYASHFPLRFVLPEGRPKF
jgi:hypothetical protein